MSVLMLEAEASDERAPVTRLGGRPLAPVDLAWPTCTVCHVPMQFVGQLRLRDADAAFADRMLLVWMCFDRCSPDAHRALSVPVADLHPCEPPAEAIERAQPTRAVSFQPFRGTYEEARLGDHAGYVLGHMGGDPDTVSGFVPSCADCGSPMAFVAQLEEGSGRELNFNGTTGVAFACRTCPAAFFYVDDFY